MPEILKLLIITFLLAACEKNYPITDNEVPIWLQEKIAEDEATIEKDPQRMVSYGAWIRYEYKGGRFYEYDNPLSSLSQNPYSETGERINTQEARFNEYWDKKCCEKYIWEAPEYKKIR